MSTVKVLFAAESHPDQHDSLGPLHWTFSPECLDRMVEQAVGLPVTVNFEGEPVGQVVGAERTDGGLMLEIEAENEIAQRVASPDLKGLGLTDD